MRHTVGRYEDVNVLYTLYIFMPVHTYIVIADFHNKICNIVTSGCAFLFLFMKCYMFIFRNGKYNIIKEMSTIVDNQRQISF